MDDLADRLSQIMAQRDLKASQIADATGITRPVMSRYLANRSGISAENLIKLSQYLNVSPDWLLNGSDAPESIKMSKDVSVDKNTIIDVQKKYIANLEKQVKEWEDWKASSKDRHAKGRDKSFKPSATVKGLLDLFEEAQKIWDTLIINQDTLLKQQMHNRCEWEDDLIGEFEELKLKVHAMKIELEFATEQDKEDYLRSQAKAHLAISKNKRKIESLKKRKPKK